MGNGISAKIVRDEQCAARFLAAVFHYTGAVLSVGSALYDGISIITKFVIPDKSFFLLSCTLTGGINCGMEIGIFIWHIAIIGAIL